jgi:rubrerythrin
VEFTYVAGTREIERRIIRLIDAAVGEVVQKTSGGGEEKCTTPRKNIPEVVKIFSEGGEKNCGDNITINNTKTTTPTGIDAENSETGPPQPEGAAAQNILTTAELKAAFARIDRELVFDPDFYDRAGAYLAQSGLDNRYLSWLYKQCLLREPKSLAGLYYKLFFAPNMTELFLVRHAPQAPPPVVWYTCPVCGIKHDSLDPACPVCGLDKYLRDDPDEIERARLTYHLPPDQKAAFHAEYAALLELPMSEFRNILHKQRELYQKYGIG